MENIKQIARSLRRRIYEKNIDEDFWFTLGVLLKEIENYDEQKTS